MKKSNDELDTDVDATIEQLIETSALMKAGKKSGVEDTVLDALSRTQDSLIARLIHRQAETKQEQIRSIRQEELKAHAVRALDAIPKKSGQKLARARKASSRSRG